MKKFNKIGSILLAGVMALSLAVPAFAADITADSSTGTVPLIVQTDNNGDLTFKVTLPTSLTVVVDKDGTVTTTDTEIVNGSAGAVKVTNMTMTAASGWALASYDDNFGKYGVGQKVIGASINNCKTSTTGIAFTANEFKNDNGEAYMWAGIGNGIDVAAHNKINLHYDVKIPGQTTPINETAATVVFTAGWYV